MWSYSSKRHGAVTGAPPSSVTVPPLIAKCCRNISHWRVVTVGGFRHKFAFGGAPDSSIEQVKIFGVLKMNPDTRIDSNERVSADVIVVSMAKL